MFFSGGGIPFMFGGGMPGMGGGMHAEEDDDHAGGASKEVNTTHFYEVLGVSKEATQTEIKRAYMQLAKKEHPDKGGDPEKFKEISKAYETLSDPEKRASYDRFGEGGAESSGPSPEDMFSMLFGGGARRGAPAGPRKSDDTMHPVKVSLEDLYSGKTLKVAVGRTIYERDPEGNIMDRSGNRYRKRTERMVLDVVVERGMKKGQRITFAGQGDQTPGMLPGDVVIIIDEKPHEVFQRRGADLIMKKEITLLEALTGYSFVLEHLDGRSVFISSPPGLVLNNESVLQVGEEGMPVYGHTHVKGVLFLSFEVKMPDRLDITDAMRKVLSGILPPPAAPVPKLTAGMVPRALEEADMEARKARERLAKDAYDSDEEGGGGGGFGGQRVQCAQQ